MGMATTVIQLTATAAHIQVLLLEPPRLRQMSLLVRARVAPIFIGRTANVTTPDQNSRALEFYA